MKRRLIEKIVFNLCDVFCIHQQYLIKNIRSFARYSDMNGLDNAISWMSNINVVRAEMNLI